MTNRAEIILAGKDASGPAFASVGQRLDGLASKVPGVSNGIVGIAKAAAAGIAGLGLSAGAAYAAFEGLVGKAAELQDISEKTGASAEAFAGLAVAAEVGGTSLEELTTKSIKLTKNLTEVTDESKATGAALKALNIPINEFKAADPVTRFELLAKALAKFQNGAGKTAVLEDIVKGGAQLLPFLNELEQQGGRQVKLTNEQIALADAYKDKQARTSAELRVYAQTIALDVLPVVVTFKQTLADVAKELVGLNTASEQATGKSAVRTFAEESAKALAVMLEGVVGVGRALYALSGNFQAVYADVKLFSALGDKLTPQGFIKGLVGGDGDSLSTLFAERQRAAAEANRRNSDLASYDGTALSRRLAASFAEQDRLRTPEDAREARRFDNAAAAARGDVVKPQLNYTGKVDLAGAAASASALAKKQLDGDLKDIARQLQAQRDLYQFNGQQLQQIYDEGNTALSDFFAQRRQLRERFNADEDALQQREIGRIQQQLQALPRSAKPEERADLENRLAEAVDKRARTQARAGQDAVLLLGQERKAAEDLRRTYGNFTAELLGLRGDQRGADLVRIAQQVEEARKLTSQAGGDPRRVEEYNRLLQGQAAFNALQTDASRITELAANAEERYTLAAQQGYLAENDLLREQGRIRQGALAQIAGLVEQAGLLKDALQTPEAIANYDRLLTQFQRLSAEADPLARKMRDFNDQVGSIGADGFRDLISGGKSFADVLGNIGKRLADLILQKAVFDPLSTAIAGGLSGKGPAGGALGGIGGFFSSLLGGGGGTAAAAASTGSLGLDSIFGGFFANGGDPPVGKFSIVGERGPELLFPKTAGTILPNNMLQNLGGQSVTVVNNFTISGPVDRRTQAQIAAAAGMGAQQALRRNT